ncbi:hypothetical protein FEM48_Zijuj01G0004500 [Ziziphus jujuba var. spinosa]|uniref:Uncharacterized protein n=1 Tax=Ziziphus jujuba var. spinosa TaxID=714518 RepID=A0A978VY31_ZIZJJ|nr:hypothetical protein FEM48_Zijuj01G0004500 [Ziziphus jujuba var. spinosa]
MTRLTFINNHGIQSWCESYSSRTGPSPDEHVKFKDAKVLMQRSQHILTPTLIYMIPTIISICTYKMQERNLEPIVPAQCTQNQAYRHKILTGRRSRMQTIRQTVGLAGFRKRDESAHDAFGSGHISISISAGLRDPINCAILYIYSFIFYLFIYYYFFPPQFWADR